MSGKKRGAVVLWVLAALLLAAVLAGFFAGYGAVKDAGRGTAWHLSLSGFALRALSEEELASYDPAREYYELEFELANNSERELQLDSYWFSVRPESGNKYAVQVVSGDDSAQFALRPVAPIGTSTTVRLVLAVRPEEMGNRRVQLLFDEYGEQQQMGTFDLP